MSLVNSDIIARLESIVKELFNNSFENNNETKTTILNKYKQDYPKDFNTLVLLYHIELLFKKHNSNDNNANISKLNSLLNSNQ